MGKDPVDAADLAMLVRVVDAGGVTRAAEVMYVSQPAVTHRLRRLERVLGARLVERQGRRLALTDAGQAILPLARQALQILEQIPAAISEVQGLLRGEIILGASTTVGEFLLPKRLSAFGRAHPHITVRLHIANTQAIVERVLDHSLHAGFVGLRPTSSTLVTVPFLADTIVLVAAPSHPLAGRRVSSKELEQTRLLLREDGSATRAMALSALARCGVDTDVAVGFGSNAAVRTAVLAGYGVAALSRAVVGDDLEQGRLKLVRPQDWRCRRRFYIIRRRDRRLTTAEEILLKFVHQEE
ncbi:MAG: LysR family transcriptional regulator [Bacillati bacterium ANGP1]|uniref:LysR family transcriptional regulator n=1 Tax=Candidatus Segetimicrobium genomatis TaxID=2569760 RepID=A0A537J9L1_9BACT|nr:MAG: LysR family transcriptional regulator [Terrabacteria group bacterium ANGP1]